MARQVWLICSLFWCVTELFFFNDTATTEIYTLSLHDALPICIDSWDKCKDAFIGKYYPPAKIIQLRSNIMNFKQLDNEHVAQAQERMKSLVKKCPTHGLTTWMVIQTFYEGLNFTSRNLLDSAAGGTFMSTTLGAATNLLDEMMTNYSQWHDERAPTGRKVNSVGEISSLNENFDLIMSLLNKQSPVDPDDVPLNSLVAQE